MIENNFSNTVNDGLNKPSSLCDANVLLKEEQTQVHESFDAVNNESGKCDVDNYDRCTGESLYSNECIAENADMKLDVPVLRLMGNKYCNGESNDNYPKGGEVSTLPRSSNTEINTCMELSDDVAMDNVHLEDGEIVDDVLHIEPEMELTISDEVVVVIKSEPAEQNVEHAMLPVSEVATAQTCFSCGRQFCKITSFESSTTFICDECNSIEPKDSARMKIVSHASCASHVTSTTTVFTNDDSVPMMHPSSPEYSTLSEQQYVHFKRKCGQCGLKNIVETRSLSWELMDFCSEDCLGLYQLLLGCRCANCKDIIRQIDTGKYCLRVGLDIRQFCSVNCLDDNRKNAKICGYCLKDTTLNNQFLSTLGDKVLLMDFCSERCMNELYFQIKEENRPVTKYGTCSVCSNNGRMKSEAIFDDSEYKLCDDSCISAFKLKNHVTSIEECDICKKLFDDNRPNAIFVYDDDKPLNFCSTICLNTYILTRRRLIPCNWCKIMKYNFSMIKKVMMNGECLEMCSLYCLTRCQYYVISSSSSTRKTPKSSAQRTKEYRDRKRAKETQTNETNEINDSSTNGATKRQPKSAAERVREYRARKKALTAQ